MKKNISKFILVLSALSLSSCALYTVLNMPGNSIAGPTLRRDTYNPVRVVSLQNMPACRDSSIINTQVYEMPKSPKDDWREIWQVKNCGQIVPVYITFIPDAVGEGTTYHLSLNKFKDMK